MGRGLIHQGIGDGSCLFGVGTGHDHLADIVHFLFGFHANPITELSRSSLQAQLSYGALQDLITGQNH